MKKLLILLIGIVAISCSKNEDPPQITAMQWNQTVRKVGDKAEFLVHINNEPTTLMWECTNPYPEYFTVEKVTDVMGVNLRITLIALPPENNAFWFDIYLIYKGVEYTYPIGFYYEYWEYGRR